MFKTSVLEPKSCLPIYKATFLWMPTFLRMLDYSLFKKKTTHKKSLPNCEKIQNLEYHVFLAPGIPTVLAKLLCIFTANREREWKFFFFMMICVIEYCLIRGTECVHRMACQQNKNQVNKVHGRAYRWLNLWGLKYVCIHTTIHSLDYAH